MSFKVGDRVEVLTPADGAAYSPNNVGEGTVLSIDNENYQVKVDSNTNAWFYRKDQLRPLGTSFPCPSVIADGREDRCGQFSHPRRCKDGVCTMTDTEPTPKPSIQVGIQVRLTGEELAEEFRRLAAEQRCLSDVATVHPLITFFDGRREAFEQAAQMVEERLNG